MWRGLFARSSQRYPCVMFYISAVCSILVPVFYGPRVQIHGQVPSFSAVCATAARPCGFSYSQLAVWLVQVMPRAVSQPP